MESLYRYVSILLGRLFYHLQLEKKTKGECSDPLVNPSGPTFNIYPEYDHFPSHLPLAVWCKPSPSPAWFLQQPHHISLFCHRESFLVILQTSVVILLELARSHQSHMFKAPKGLRTCIIQPQGIWHHHLGTSPGHTPCLSHSGLAGPQTRRASLMLTSSSSSRLLMCHLLQGAYPDNLIKPVTRLPQHSYPLIT